MHEICQAQAIELRWIPHRLTTAVWALGILFLVADGARATEAASPLAGRWRAAVTAEEQQQRLQAIEDAIGRLDSFRRSMVRGRLLQRTSPPRRLILEVEGSKVTLASADRRLELKLGGSPIEVSGSEGKARVSAKMEGSQLIVAVRGGKGERTTAYRANGPRLSVEVTMTGSHLAGPLKYVSTYARME